MIFVRRTVIYHIEEKRGMIYNEKIEAGAAFCAVRGEDYGLGGNPDGSRLCIQPPDFH